MTLPVDSRIIFPMNSFPFHAAVLFSGCATLLRGFFYWSKNQRFKYWTTLCERVILLSLTLGIVTLVGKIQVIDGQIFGDLPKKPISLVLFTWCLLMCFQFSETLYGSLGVSIPILLWTLGILIFPIQNSIFSQQLFTQEVSWLSIHRLFFLLGYSFAIVAFLISAKNYLNAVATLIKTKRPNEWKSIFEAKGFADRMVYRMVLWALPLLTLGIFIEVIFYLENQNLPAPYELLNGRKDALLPLLLWILCGIYLHSRLFWQWNSLRTGLIYFAGFLIIVLGKSGLILLGT